MVTLCSRPHGPRFGAWTGSPDTPSAASAIDAMACAIAAASGPAAKDHASRNASLAGFRLAVCASFWSRIGM